MHIEVFAPIPDCYLRMAHAMDEVKKFLMPVSVNCIFVTLFYYIYFPPHFFTLRFLIAEV